MRRKDTWACHVVNTVVDVSASSSPSQATEHNKE